MAKSDHIKHEGVTFNAAILAGKSWEQVQQEAHEMREANQKGSPVAFSNWGDKADEKLREAYDKAVQKVGKPAPAAPAEPAKASGIGKGKSGAPET